MSFNPKKWTVLGSENILYILYLNFFFIFTSRERLPLVLEFQPLTIVLAKPNGIKTLKNEHDTETKRRRYARTYQVSILVVKIPKILKSFC